MNINEIKEKIDSLNPKALVIESYWVKKKGWGVILSAIIPEASSLHPEYTDIPLHFFQGYGGDMRIIIRDVPPWPEVEEARELGELIEKEMNIPYLHNAPDNPTENIIRWWNS